MNGVFCKRLKTLSRDLGVYESARRSFLFGVRTISSDTGEGWPPKAKRQREAEACQSYLVNKFGLSPKKAEKVSRNYWYLKPERADAVVQILKDHEFDDIQVSTLVKRAPQVIFLDANKTILPKMQFFSSLGMTNKDLVRIVTANPALLTMSLKKSLVPKLEFLKTLLVDNGDVVQAIKNNARIFLYNGDKIIVPNVTILREAGVPQLVMRRMMIRYVSVVLQSRAKFDKFYDEVTKMGFHPKKSSFIDAMRVFSSSLKACRESKMDVLRRFGMTESEIQSAFKKEPKFMVQSDEKLTKKMEFLVKDMHSSPSAIAWYPTVLLFSLENRLMPRCSVIRLLQSEGLVGNDLSLRAILHIKDNAFYNKFVAGYLGKVPQLLDLYHRKKMSSLGFPGIKQL